MVAMIIFTWKVGCDFFCCDSWSESVGCGIKLVRAARWASDHLHLEGGPHVALPSCAAVYLAAALCRRNGMKSSVEPSNALAAMAVLSAGSQEL